MSSRTIICAAAFLLAALSYQSSAGTIEGSFTGTASGGRDNARNGTYTPYSGEPVTGGFSLNTDLPPPDTGCCDPPTLEDGKLFYRAFVFDFSIHAFDHDISNAELDDFPNSVTWADDGLSQSLTVTGGGPYWYWVLGLVDPDGGLFSNFDPATFDATQVDIGKSFFNFSDDIRSYGATVAFDTLTIDGHSLQVPEPATLGLLGLGLLLLPLAKRRTREKLTS